MAEDTDTFDPDDVNPPQRSCHTMEVFEMLCQADPDYAGRLAALEDQTSQYIASVESGQSGGIMAKKGVTRIPVVVHVVYNDARSNISDEQITSQIDVLNADYRKCNTDLINTPDVWGSLTADTNVEFFLATEDPDGNPTTGITRTETTVASFSQNNAVKADATGGHDPWATDKYLNIWVCKLGSGLLGYAQFPNGPADTDGVVIRHTAFGTTGTAADPYNLGRTTTHEVGHWLNLRHIWGDVEDCSGSDFVDDTPNAGGPNYGKPTFPHVTCKNGPNGDMFCNYMDYVDDDSMMMFTRGQALRMAATLAGPRSTIGS